MRQIRWIDETGQCAKSRNGKHLLKVVSFPNPEFPGYRTVPYRLACILCEEKIELLPDAWEKATKAIARTEEKTPCSTEDEVLCAVCGSIHKVGELRTAKGRHFECGDEVFHHCPCETWNTRWFIILETDRCSSIPVRELCSTRGRQKSRKTATRRRSSFKTNTTQGVCASTRLFFCKFYLCFVSVKA